MIEDRQIGDLTDLSELARLANSDIEKVPLDEIALMVARERYPDLQCHTYRERLDEFARRAKIRVDNVLGGIQIAQALSRYLFEEEGFRGNKSDYYNPSNSFLNDVLDQRVGIPITLSILYMAVGRRLNLPVCGVGFPGHFLVRFADADETFFIDPFHQGKILSTTDCVQRLQETYGEALPFQPEFLNPSCHRDILIRILTNLKIIYMNKKEFPMALQILNKVLLFHPDGTNEIKERGILYYQMECFGQALKDLSHYLKNSHNAPDRSVIEECIEDLRAKVSRIQ